MCAQNVFFWLAPLPLSNKVDSDTNHVIKWIRPPSIFAYVISYQTLDGGESPEVRLTEVNSNFIQTFISYCQLSLLYL